MLTVENFTISEIREAIADFSHKDKVIFAVYCAELVIDIYENKNDSKAPRLAIEATKEWIKDPTEKNKKKCINADYDNSFAAAYAADAAAAAYAAADAAAFYAAADFADAAADAAAVKTKIIDKINEMKEHRDQLNDRWNIEGLPNQSYTPEVGEECETRNFALAGDWQKCKVIAMHDTEVWMQLERNPTSNIYEVGFYEFRPPKTERDKLLEQAVSDISGDSKTQNVSLKGSEQIGKLIDAGWRPSNDN